MTPSVSDAIYTILFYLIAGAAFLMALIVVNTKHLLRAAIALMGVLVTGAGFYLMLGFEFLAGVQVLVYVGGIVVLIVFAIMLTRSADLEQDNPSLMRKVLGGVSSIGFMVLTGAAFWLTPFTQRSTELPVVNDTPLIGKALMDMGPNGYVLPFEIISLLLLAVMIGGIVIARKVPPPEQPFTSGGDLPGEADFEPPFTQQSAELREDK